MRTRNAGERREELPSTLTKTNTNSNSKACLTQITSWIGGKEEEEGVVVVVVVVAFCFENLVQFSNTQ